MYQRKGEDISNIDWITLILFIILIVLGWLSIYGASYDYEKAKGLFDLTGRAGKQLVWIGTSLLLGFIILKLDSNSFDTFSYFIYGGFIVLLLVTIFIAPDIKGSRSWLVITNDIRLQPAEFAKFGVALALAKFIGSYNFKLLEFRNLSVVVGIIALPFLLIIMQKETGSALVYTAFIIVLFREGLPGVILIALFSSVVLFVIGLKYSEVSMGILTQGECIAVVLIIFLAAVLIGVYIKYSRPMVRNILLGLIIYYAAIYLLQVLGLPINWGIVSIISFTLLISYLIFGSREYWNRTYLWIMTSIIVAMGFVCIIDNIFNDILEPHQQIRIRVALGIENDIMGAGYNVNQSKIAIGSGGVLGKGFLKGTQTKLKYVPEQDTDFIFCTVGEEQGFVGSVGVLILFLILILRLLYLAEQQKNTFGRVYGYSVASILLFHVAINIGMVVGIVPVIGIPLPFFSYGGSSLWGFTILLFIFLRIDMSRKGR